MVTSRRPTHSLSRVEAGPAGLCRPAPDAWPDPFAVLGPIAKVCAKAFLHLYGTGWPAATLRRYGRVPYPELDEGDSALKW